MIHDSLDLFTPRGKFTATGKYWKERPDSTQEGGTAFKYEYVDVLSKTYRRAFGNIQDFEGGEVSIRTNDMHEFTNGQYIKSQDGILYMIKQVALDYSAAPKQAFRVQSLPVGVQYVMRLVTVPDAWGVI